MNTQPRTIRIFENGAGTRKRGPGVCRSCGTRIFWCETANGKPIAFDEVPEVITTDGRLETVSTEGVHFSTCPQAREWSRK